MKKSLLPGFLVAAALGLSAVQTASAQTPTPSPTPASDKESIVYLHKDYTKALEANKLFDSDKFVAVFIDFEGDFATFRQAGSNEKIYIPKSAILYMRGPGEPRLKVTY